MPAAGDWLEIRSNAPGILAGLGFRHETPPDGAAAHEGIFSVVVDHEDRRTRALPMLYHGKAQIFAHRDVAVLGERVSRAVETIAEADERATFMANACRVDGRHGLYARDVFNRSSFRLHMSRLGTEFALDPYVSLTESGRFTCKDWGEFEPEFMIAGGPYPDDETAVENRSGGMAPFMFGILRVGQIKAPELTHLAAFVRRAPVLASHSARAIYESLRAA